MAGYDYNYRPGYSTGNGVGTYTDQWGQTRYGTPPEVEPVRNYGYASGDKLRRPPSPPRQVVDDVTTIVHTETIRDQPSRTAPFNGVNWQAQPNQTGYSGTTGYGDYGDYNNNTLYKPNGNTSRNDNHDGYYNRKPTNGHRAKPSRSSTLLPAALPVRGDGRLSIPTDDMERALHYLRESAKSSAWPRTT